MEGGVAPGAGASFEFVEYLLAEALPLIVGMNTIIVISAEIYWQGDRYKQCSYSMYPTFPTGCATS